MARVVLPVPGLPSIRYWRNGGRPPHRISSRPPIPIPTNGVDGFNSLMSGSPGPQTDSTKASFCFIVFALRRRNQREFRYVPSHRLQRRIDIMAGWRTFVGVSILAIAAAAQAASGASRRVLFLTATYGFRHEGSINASVQ